MSYGALKDFKVAIRTFQQGGHTVSAELHQALQTLEQEVDREIVRVRNNWKSQDKRDNPPRRPFISRQEGAVIRKQKRYGI